MQPEPLIPEGLPVPDTTSLEHSGIVADFLRARIDAAGGMIGMAEFMQHALYAPGLGYYMAGNRKFGAGGDFVTAPEVSPIFGRTIARQCAPVVTAVNGGILELGAGSGALAVTLLQKLAELDALPASYQILEVSPELCERQMHNIAAEVPDLACVVSWIDALPVNFSGVVVANEVLDALPVERFVRTTDDVLQLCAGHRDGKLVYQTRSADEPLRKSVLEIEAQIGGQLEDGYVSEVSLGLPGWLGDVLGALAEGLVLLFDYGVRRQEYYAADRDRGWLRCHFRHHAHNEPLIYPGIQDITAWVDFTAVAESAHRQGADIAGFVTQALFLMNAGLENELAGFDSMTRHEQLELSQQIKQLTLPGEMGENFKCMGLCKGSVSTPDAFNFGDRAHSL